MREGRSGEDFKRACGLGFCEFSFAVGGMCSRRYGRGVGVLFVILVGVRDRVKGICILRYISLCGRLVV